MGFENRFNVFVFEVKRLIEIYILYVLEELNEFLSGSCGIFDILEDDLVLVVILEDKVSILEMVLLEI